jgi:arginase family enzyme
MDLKGYLQAYQLESDLNTSGSDRLGSYVDFYSEDFQGDVFAYDVFILGVPEGRLSLKNETCAFAPDEIRASFYELYRGEWNLKVLDLGNLKLGQKVEDTYVALEELTSHLIQEGKVLLVLGGGHDLITPMYKGHCAFGKPLNFASADAYLDFQDGDNYHSRSFLSQLLASKESLLSKYCLFGYQTYLCSPNELSLLEQMDFNLLRLGEVNADIKEVEPYMRDLDHLSVDLSVVKHSEASATVYSSPNGMTAEGLCAMLRYAGMSHGIKSVLFSDLNPRLDKNGQSVKVYAQAIWYFVEGLHLRYDDFPDEERDNFQRFYVSSELSDLIFYKSEQSGRWWVEFPNEDPLIEKPLLPCSLLDYKKAVDGLLSDRLLKQVRF